jgi:23S rRNA pseudouridine2605 synthase
MKKSASHPFTKFGTKKSNAAIKEQFKQEKRKAKKEREAFFEQKKAAERIARGGGKTAADVKGNFPKSHTIVAPPERMPLNKYLAHAGVAARREAALLIKKGLVKVNGVVMLEPGCRIAPQDVVTYNGKKLAPAQAYVYILLNKPKDYITTTDDPQGRKTVLDIVEQATTERIYPVGRLDRNTAGVLLLTNDGELAQQLTHPKNQVKKIYQATLNKPLEKKDFDKLLQGIVLEDGPAAADVLAYADGNDKSQVGIEIHSGRNRIVRRMFEHLGYDVKNLDRVVFAGLTKKNVPRGKWRFLSEKEVRDLKHFGKGK